MTGIWAIVLAAGESRRMGSPKMVLPYQGMTIIGKVLDNILASNVEKVVAVLGGHKEVILEVIRVLPVMHCYNDHYIDGMFTSVQCGFRFLPDGFRAAIVFLGDQPMAETIVINRLIEAYNVSDKGIAIPVYENQRGHPLLIDQKYRNEIISLDEPDGLRGFLRRHPDDILEVNTISPSILKDIDTREEYDNEINKA
jgi:molybdenum cofactor cytidylyltransferase